MSERVNWNGWKYLVPTKECPFDVKAEESSGEQVVVKENVANDKQKQEYKNEND